MELTLETLEQHWLPFTNNRDFKREPRLFVRASGMYYWSQNGQKILDGCSGLFTTRGRPLPARDRQRRWPSSCRPSTIHAVLHARPSGRVCARQRGRGAHAAGSEATSFSAIPARRRWTPPSRSRSPITSRARKAQRTYLVSRERAYHGVNMGGTALWRHGRNREAFGALMPGVLHLRHTLLPQNRLTRGMGAQRRGTRR